MDAHYHIESLVSYLHDPSWKPVHVKGYNFPTDLSHFRRCTPLGMLPETEDNIFFMDATLGIAGVQSQSVVRFSDTGMPVYANLRKERLSARYRRLPGESFVLRRTDITPLCPDGLIGLENAVCLYQGQWRACPIIDQRVVGGAPGDDVVKSAQAISGIAFTERYSPHVEIDSGNGTSVSLPLGLETLREVLRDRDRPESGDRRPALIHLVRSHKRLVQGEATRVREFLRGKVQCAWRGWQVTIHPAIYDLDRLSVQAAKA